MKELKILLDLAFLSNERCCPSDSKYSYHSIPIKSLYQENITLISPNQKVKDKLVDIDKLILMAINPMVEGFRNDSNVSLYRNFLFEIDTGSLAQQLNYCESIGLPYSLAIYSGNRSIHFLTCLEESLDEKTYRLFYKWALSIGTLFDQNCKTPSKSVRIPGVIRPDTGKEQKIIKIKNKVKIDTFLEWLNKYEHLKPEEKGNKKYLTKEIDYDSMSMWARNQFSRGIDFSQGRNRAYFALACDLCKSGFNEEQAIAILTKYFVEQNDFEEKEFLTTINSAFKYIHNKV